MGVVGVLVIGAFGVVVVEAKEVVAVMVVVARGW